MSLKSSTANAGAKRRKSARAKVAGTKPKTPSRPFVFANYAMTSDGKIAFADHSFMPFGSKRDQEHMMELRATADAVMSGARTVDSGPTTLGTGGAKYRRLRLKRGLSEHNLRIIVSGSGSIDPDAEIFKHRFSPIIILTTQRAGPARLKKLRSLAIVKICGAREINFPIAFRWLHREWKVKRLLSEGGGELNDALLRAGLLDELHLTICPTIFGGRTAPTLADGVGFSKLVDAAPFQLKSSRRIGDELFLVYQRAGAQQPVDQTLSERGPINRKGAKRQRRKEA
jgi:5-amino-6-(5-phosphoribosylamino)uracil reductase